MSLETLYIQVFEPEKQIQAFSDLATMSMRAQALNTQVDMFSPPQLCSHILSASYPTASVLILQAGYNAIWSLI